MALTFEFEENNSSLFGKIYRPVAQVFFFSQSKDRWYETWMIVDTGADYTLLPKYFAERLGVNLVKDCKIFETSGVGGKEKVHLYNKMKIRLGSWERIIPVGFLSRDNIPPLLGRHKFLETFESLFSSSHKLTFSVK